MTGVQTCALPILSTGSVITIRYEGDSDTETYLLGSIEERRDGMEIMSPTSPLGTALMGHRPGDTVEYVAPGGHLRVAIVSISA